MIAGTSASAKNLVPTLLKNAKVRDSLANTILDQVLVGTEAPLVAGIRARRSEFVSAISAELLSPATIDELQKDVVIGYDFVATSQPTRTIDIRPLLNSLLSAMSQVDPLYQGAKQVLEALKPLTLTRSASMPEIGQWLSFAWFLYIALILLLALSLFFFLRFAASAKRALRGIGIRVLVVGVLTIGQFFAFVMFASAYAKNATNTMIATIVPVAARALFSYYQTLGIALVVLGAIAVFISTRLRAPTEQLDQKPGES